MTEEVEVQNRTGGGPRKIVVGYDGSPVAQAAVAYAARRAGADGELVIVHAYGPPPDWQGTVQWERSLAHHEEHGRRLFGELADDLTSGVHVEEKLVLGPAARTLVEVAEAHASEEIVVGSRGFGPFRAILGSVSHALLHEAHVPVVIVPARMLGTAPDTRSPHVIVVGYDGSPTANDALAHAAYRAGPEGSLVAVHVFGPPFAYGGAPFYDDAARDARARAETTLAEIAADLVGAVPLERVVAEAPVADALVQVARSKRADEIVVGSRGLGRFRAALGSVSHAVLHEADRPVVVVPHARPASERDASVGLDLTRRVRLVPWV